MDRLFASLAAIGGFLAIAAGTIGAHILRDSGDYPADQVSSFFTGVEYHFYHVFALFAVAWTCGRKASGLKEVAGWTMIVGSILFCGSLYMYGFTRGQVFGYIAAGGGVVLMIAWLMLAAGVWDIQLRPETPARKPEG